MHRMFGIRINLTDFAVVTDSTANGSKPSEAIHRLSARLHDMGLLLVDEYSMVGKTVAYIMEQRVQRAKGVDKPFGGCATVSTIHESVALC